MIEIVIVGVPAAISFRSCWDAPCPKRKMDCKCVQKKSKGLWLIIVAENYFLLMIFRIS